jgi:hypothetical protein
MTLEAHLPGGPPEHEGEYVLVKGYGTIGSFATRDEALAASYARFGVAPPFVKQVAASETIHHRPNALR